MEAHQERVVTEKSELDAKIEKLKPFMDGPIFAGLRREDQYLLSVQLIFMDGYSKALGLRIASFGSGLQVKGPAV